MKKFAALFIILVICLSLVACGGPDVQPAIDAFNQASNAFDEIAVTINADPNAYDPEVIDVMIEMADMLAQHKELLESGQDFTEESLNEMIAWYGDVVTWAGEVKAELGME